MSMKQTPRDLDKHPQDSNDSLDQTSWPASTNAVYVSGGVWSTIPSTPPTVTPSPHLDARRYQLISLLGEGGMGQVWEAIQENPQRSVALKLLRAAIISPAARERFKFEVEILGRMPYSSNATFLVDIRHDDLEAQAIYKPLRGESPLWDFPDGLYKREIAAFRASEALGWGVVPPTIQRDLVHGVGSLQLFMPCIFEEHYFTLREEIGSALRLLRRDGALYRSGRGRRARERRGVLHCAPGRAGLRRASRCA